MSAKQHLNFHGTVSTFVCRLHPSMTELLRWVCQRLQLLKPCFRPRERGINADKKRVDLDVCLCGRRQAVTSSGHSCDNVRKVSLFSLVICVSSRAIESSSFVSAALEACQCAKHCANDFGDFGVLHCVHQCVLATSRVALRLGRRVLLTEGVTNVAFSSIS